MTINSLQLNTSVPVAGLGTQTLNILTAGIYTVQFRSFIPYQPAGSSYRSDQTPPSASALQVVVNVNGAPILTVGGVGTNPTPTQPTVSGSVTTQCAAADVITVVFSSANAVDAAPNAVKSVVNIFAGE